jgi:hypothetical protein
MESIGLSVLVASAGMTQSRLGQLAAEVAIPEGRGLRAERHGDFQILGLFIVIARLNHDVLDTLDALPPRDVGNLDDFQEFFIGFQRLKTIDEPTTHAPEFHVRQPTDLLRRLKSVRRPNRDGLGRVDALDLTAEFLAPPLPTGIGVLDGELDAARVTGVDGDRVNHASWSVWSRYGVNCSAVGMNS